MTTAVSFLIIGLTLWRILPHAEAPRRRGSPDMNRSTSTRRTMRRLEPRFDVELVAVTKRFDQTVAVDAISLRIPPRQLLLPAGPERLRQDHARCA